MIKHNKCIVYLDMFYPNMQGGETFLASEIGYCELAGVQKVIYPIWSKNGADEVQLSGFDVVKGKKYGKVKKALYGIKALGNSLTYSEIIELLRSHRMGFHNIKTAIGFVADGDYFSNVLVEYIRNNINIGSEILLYSYWMHWDAYTALQTIDKLKGQYYFRVITRCHRYDVYEYAAKGNYLPARKYIINGVEKILPISDNAKSYIMNRYNVGEDKFQLCRLGSFDHGISYSKKAGILRILSCSWMRKVKRIDLICEALEKVDFPVEWTHIGSGEEEKRIKDLSRQIQNPYVKCHFMGALNNNEVIQYYLKHQVHIFLNVSASEGVPVSVMEALSFGKPVIATDVGGTGEIVNDGENGYILPINFTLEELNEKLKRVSSMEENEYQKMCMNARKIWEEKCDAEKQYHIFSALLKEYL